MPSWRGPGKPGSPSFFIYLSLLRDSRMSMIKIWDRVDYPPLWAVELRDLVTADLDQPLMKGFHSAGLRWLAVRCLRTDARYTPPTHKVPVLFHQVYSDLPEVWAVTDYNGAVPFSVFRSERGATAPLVERLLNDHPVEGYVNHENQLIRVTYIKK